MTGYVVDASLVVKWLVKVALQARQAVTVVWLIVAVRTISPC